MTDEAVLVRRTRGGDAAAYEQLMLRHTQAVRAVAIALGADWEDIVQETFFRAYVGIKKLDDPAKFRGWALAIARNLCRQEFRQKELAKQAVQHLPPRPDPPDERIDALRAAIDQLPEDYRIVVEMHHFEKLSYEEIGNRLGLGWNGVKARLARARAMVRERMSEKP